MILVTGGTGLVGSHLLFHLVNNNESVRAIYRSAHKFKLVKRVFGYYSNNIDVLFNKIEWVNADITDTPALEIAFKNITKVYHCAADLSFGPQNYEASKETNVIGTANIVNFCLSESVQKLCYVSSIATLGEYKNQLITEETTWNPEMNKNNIYAITKYNAEMEIWRGTQEGLDAVIVNPGVILGPGFWNSNTGDLFTKIHNGLRFYTAGSVGVVGVNDVVKTMILLMQAEIKNERFIVVSDNISYQKLIQTINDGFQYKKKLIPVKKWVLNMVYYLEKIACLFTKRNPSLSKANIASSYKNLNYDNTKIKNAIHFNFTPINETIKNCCTLFVKDLL